MTALRVYLSAGEPSGDRHAGALARAISDAAPGAELEGMGGKEMASAGVAITHPSEQLSTRGLAEVAAQVPAHLRIARDLRRRFRQGAYDLVILVDYPGFHLRVAAAAREAGIPVLYYIAPQLWAWGAWRAARLRASIDQLAVILPFEEPFFRTRGIPAKFVGHPLLEYRRSIEAASAREALGAPAAGPLLGIFPGSRPAEIARHWPVFRDAARRVRRAVPEVAVVVAGIDGAAYAGAEEFILHRGDPALAFAAADAGLCKSGTTTLEAALADTPHVVAYKMHPLTYAAARRVVRVPWIGLVNLVAGRTVSPELIQHSVTPQRLAESVLPLLDPAGSQARGQRVAFEQVRAALGTPGAARRVAGLALDLAA
ncbi:MAG: lipid-A-disaccharide synthase [Gemmatimonadetes bacterium]|nr:lipid-A-disaccharide synthase [Gemmatimonadota bacterium]